VEIRAALSTDAQSIADIIKSVWPDQNPDLKQIRSALLDASHCAFVADDGGAVVGFVDCFPTVGADGRKRYELDLMAVSPSFQGQGIGKQLVEAAVATALREGVQLIRALVQIDNIASAKALARRGFETDNSVYTLNVSSQACAETYEAPDTLYIVPVETISYKGLWLENDISDAALCHGQRRRTEDNVDVVGVLIPIQQMNDDIRQLGYSQIGDYRWWTRRL
jgi:GNAT superfamily N-acetyltransferase